MGKIDKTLTGAITLALGAGAVALGLEVGEGEIAAIVEGSAAAVAGISAAVAAGRALWLRNFGGK